MAFAATRDMDETDGKPSAVHAEVVRHGNVVATYYTMNLGAIVADKAYTVPAAVIDRAVRQAEVTTGPGRCHGRAPTALQRRPVGQLPYRSGPVTVSTASTSVPAAHERVRRGEVGRQEPVRTRALDSRRPYGGR